MSNHIIKLFTNKDRGWGRQTNLTWRRARALHTRFDCPGLRLGGDNTGYIDTISWKKIKHQILVSGKQLRNLTSEKQTKKIQCFKNQMRYKFVQGY
jgi:hypothetical protein